MNLTPAATNAIRDALGITTPIRITTTRDLPWDAYWCDITGAPAVAEILWHHTDDGATSTMVAADQVATQLDYLTDAEHVDHSIDLELHVSYWWAHYTTNPNTERIAA